MTEEKAKKLWRKHYKYAMKLKEGGKAWEREMKLCDQYFTIVMEKKINDIIALEGK